jgi:phospholipase C
MRRKIGVSYEKRLDAVEKYLRHEGSMNDIAKQLKVDKPAVTHAFCNMQAFQILSRDAVIPCTDFFRTYLKEINSGGYWTDSQWKNIDHYLEPDTGRGIWPFGNALDLFQQYFSCAFKEARQGNRRKAAFFLGAAAHLVQDMCVPHHARGRMFNGHQEYESWAMKACQDYAVDSMGIYLQGSRIAEFIVRNARVAADLLDAVDTDKGIHDYAGVSAIALPLAQRSTAGLFEHFHRVALAPQSFASRPITPISAIVA